MPGADFRDFQANQVNAAATHGQLWLAEVTRAPASTSDTVTVRSAHGAGSDKLALGNAAWPMPLGKQLPAVGDKCLVALDDTGSPWVTAWLTPGWGRGAVARGAVLPTSPEDGLEYDYVADETNGVIWRLRYRSASASTHKWEFVGGSPLFAEVTPSEGVTTAFPSWGDLGVPGPEVTAPLAGDYDYEIGVIDHEGNYLYTVLVSPEIGGATPLEEDAVMLGTGQASVSPSFANDTVSRFKRKTGIAAGAKFKLRYQYTNGASGAARLRNRWIKLQPVRVG